MNTSLPAATRKEQQRIDALRKLGCSACAHFGVPNINSLELHHILDGGHKMGHWYTIFLCRGHHQGDWNEMHFELFEPEHLVAISDSRNVFTAIYPTERQLWERAQERLRLPAIWLTSKILPRRGYAESTQGLVELPSSGGDPEPATPQATPELSAGHRGAQRGHGEAQ